MSTLVDISRLQACLSLAKQRCIQQSAVQHSSHHALSNQPLSNQPPSSVLASFSMPWRASEFRDQPNLALAPFAFLAANINHVNPLCFWASPAPRKFTVGFGAAIELTHTTHNPWSSLQTQWQHILRDAVIDGEHQPALLGGFAFDQHTSASAKWRHFPHAALTLPQFALLTCADTTSTDSHTLVINYLVDANTDCHAEAYQLAAKWQMLVARVARHRDSSHIKSTQHESNIDMSVADQAHWQQQVANAVDTIQHDAFQKVVLAREDSLHVSCCPAELLNDLAKRYPQAYLFAFSRGESAGRNTSEGNSCFIGATPERLLACEKGKIATVALAGSAPRGNTPHHDKQLGEALFSSEKDRFEHDLVVQQLREMLAEYCDTLHVPHEPVLHKLAQIQHLITPLHGVAKGDVVLLDLLERLHPSAAVGGLPRSAALDYIRKHESLDRGWYAAPVGWLDANGDGEFAVALRSALINKADPSTSISHATKPVSTTPMNTDPLSTKATHTRDSITLFAGCGIVAASNPVHEYRESGIKMNAIREAIRNVIRVPEVAE